MRKWGHEHGASPNPRAMCYDFQLSAHCQLCRHQLLGVCERCGWRGGAKQEAGVSGIKEKPQLVAHGSWKFWLVLLKTRSSVFEEKMCEDKKITACGLKDTTKIVGALIKR